MIHDLWYKNAVIYCLNVETFIDSNGDGVGDFVGLTDKLAYLAGLGVTCIWLLPFYPSPNKDNGYDVSDYYGVHPRTGTFGDFVEFMNHARQLGLRVIVDLVVNHTSDQHPWFKAARDDPDVAVSRLLRLVEEAAARLEQGDGVPRRAEGDVDARPGRAASTTFTASTISSPTSNTHNPAVKEELMRIMGFWLQLGVSGFRMDAVPFLIERKGADVKPRRDYELLHEMRDFLQWRARATRSCSPRRTCRRARACSTSASDGDRLQMMLNFWVNQRIFYTLATGDTRPLEDALLDTYHRPYARAVGHLPARARRARSRTADAARSASASLPRSRPRSGCCSTTAASAAAWRRCSATIAAASSSRTACSSRCPARRCIRYGDEIGMGDDLRLPERYAARTPMQWSTHRHGGFTTGRRPIRPRHRRRGLRLPPRQRRRPAARSEFAAELDGADHPDAQGMPGDRLGRLAAAAAAADRSARASATTGTAAARSSCTTSVISASLGARARLAPGRRAGCRTCCRRT